MRKQKGFSLIELLIVVAIILIIAAIAIPNLLKSRIAANEASAVGSLRTIVTAEMTYATSNPLTGYIALADLGGTTVGLIDTVLATGKKSGYSIAVATSGGTPPTEFTAHAEPSNAGTTGNRRFCATETGVLKYDMSTALSDHATCTSSANVVQ